MKKLFSLLAVAVLGFTACQTDEGVKNATLENEGVVSLNVSIPELATRALDGDNKSGADSAYGAIDYANYTAFLETNYDVRFQLAVYEAGADEDAEPIYTATNYVDFASTTNFNDLRFVPGREYQFVLFADFVPQDTEGDFRYNTADLRNITSFEPLNAMDETYDAYFFNKTFKIEAGKINGLEAILKRPFGKIRVLTTDLDWVDDYAVPAEGEVTFYNHAIYKSFNAVTGEVATEATNTEETLRYAIDTGDEGYYGATKYEGKEATTLFATYILGRDVQEAVNFRLDTYENDGSLIKSLDFNTDIPYQRNHLTTLVGNLLTNETDLFVRIDDDFDAEAFKSEKDNEWDNTEKGLGYVREGVQIADDSQVYEYETNLFTFQLLSETDGTVLREGKYDYTKEVLPLQNGKGFRVNEIDVEKGTLTIKDLGTRAGNTYEVVFDIYATINGKTENYILTWTGELKAPRTKLAEPVVDYEVEVDALYITFSWEAVENAANYTVEWNGEEQTVEGTSATFDFSGEDTYATASVTANPKSTWSYEASTGYVTVNWKKPITYSEVGVYLQYIKGTEVAFYNDDYTVYFEKYPSFEGAWYQVKEQGQAQTPVPFSKEAKLDQTDGSAPQVVITEPAIATKFIYTGPMNPLYILTKAEVNWVAGYNTVKVLFSNDNGDAIEFQTTAPMAAGHATIEPSYVAIAGQQAVELEKTEMNVLLEKGEYTIFFTIESATNDVLMQYVGKINFEKPAPEYTADYVFTTATAGFDTITFTNDKGQEFVIEATELVEGNVVPKALHIDNDINFDNGFGLSAVAESVTEEGGIYDARYVVKVGNSSLKLQFKGKFTPYAPEMDKVELNNANYEYLGVYKGHKITVEGYSFEIFIGELTNKQYSKDGYQDDYYNIGETKYFFTDGDSLAYDAEKEEVTVTFVADLGTGAGPKRYIVTASTKVEPKWSDFPEDAVIDYIDTSSIKAYISATYLVALDGSEWQELEHRENSGKKITKEVNGAITTFTFDDEANFRHVTITYTDPNYEPEPTPVDVTLTLDGEVYKGLYETTIYSLSGLDNGNAILSIDYAEGEGQDVPYQLVTFTEDESFITFTFTDKENNVRVTATYQKTTGPAEPEVDPSVIKLTSMSEGENNSSYYFYQYTFTDGANSTFTLAFSDYVATATTLEAKTYSFQSSIANVNRYRDQFAFNSGKTYLFNGEKSKINNGNVVVVANGDQYTIDMNFSLLNGSEVKYQYVGKIGGTATPEPEQPGTGETDEWNSLTEKATLQKMQNGNMAYVSDSYMLRDGQWWYINYDEGGQYTTEQTADGYIFTFDDEKNKLHVTITYTEEPTQPDYSNWVTAVRTDGSNMTFTGATGTITGKLGKFSLSTTTFTEVKLNDTAVNAEGTVTIALGNGDYIATLNIVIDGVTYGGSAHFNY